MPLQIREITLAENARLYKGYSQGNTICLVFIARGLRAAAPAPPAAPRCRPG
jgi:hypothetical protein